MANEFTKRLHKGIRFIAAVRLDPTKNQPMNLTRKTAIFTGGNSAAALTMILELAKLGASIAIDSVSHTRPKGACALGKTALLASLLALPWGAVCLAEETEVIAPALTMSKQDANELREVHNLLKESDSQTERIMDREGLEDVCPQLPQLSVLSENSVLALLGQIDYTNLALKLGAPLPPRPDLPTGTPVKNNRFLHAYNNLILRSIAQQLGLPVPASIELSEGDNVVDQNFLLVRQNRELLNSIDEKRGSIQP